MTNTTENTMQTLEQVMTAFVAASKEKHGTYAYPAGYLLSMVQTIAQGDEALTNRLIMQFTIAMEDYK